MSKYQTFEDLQALGSEKIHEKTHISRDKVELVLTKSYAEVGRVQFMGFLSILEREYGIDLNDIREEYDAYWQEHGSTLLPKNSVILQAPSNTKQKWLIAAVTAIVLLIGGGYFLQSFLSNEPREEVMKLSSLAVEALKQPKESNLSAEANATDVNKTLAAAELNATKPLVPLQKSVIIHPKYKVWVGMIDVASGAKTQQITSDPIVIDASKQWLVVLGHGMVKVDSQTGKEQFKEKESIRFKVENGTLTRLNRSEFLERNGGKNW